MKHVWILNGIEQPLVFSNPKKAYEKYKTLLFGHKPVPYREVLRQIKTEYGFGHNVNVYQIDIIKCEVQ